MNTEQINSLLLWYAWGLNDLSISFNTKELKDLGLHNWRKKQEKKINSVIKGDKKC